MNDLSKWTGQIALISGAGSELGIDFAIAWRLAHESVRLLIAVSDEWIKQRAEELSACGHDVRAASVNLTDEAQVQDLLDQAEAQRGRVDIPVNNADVAQLDSAEPFNAMEVTSLRDWQLFLLRNLTSAFLLTRGLLPGMRERGYERIVNVTSAIEIRGGDPSEAIYSAARTGLVDWGMGLALEVVKSGVTMNSVASGWIATASNTTEERQAALASPSGCTSRSEEMAAVMTLLVSPEASFINGELLVVDGGNCLTENKRN